MAEQGPSDPALHAKWLADPAIYTEVMGFAEYLGFDMEAHPELYWIAEQARSAPIPEAWTEHVDESGNSYYYNEETGESSWEHPLDGYFKGLYERHKAAPGSGPEPAAAAAAGGGAAGGDAGRPALRYGGSSSTSVLLHTADAAQPTASSQDLLGGKPKGATAHNLGDAPGGGGRVDMSLVQRMEQERARAGSEAQGVRVMRYEGSQSESVLSNAMARATLGAASGAPTCLPPARASPAVPGSIPDR